MRFILISFISCCYVATSYAQPILKAPYGCAQTWDASTYSSHNDIDSLDFKFWKDRTKKDDPVKQNITLGQFVVASGAGTIIKDDLLPDDKWGLVRRFIVDHGNGWNTIYLHNDIEADLMQVGRKVAIGEVIGVAGRSGTGPTNWHIHYSQKKEDEIVRSRFDDVGVATHGGNPSMIGLVNSDKAERIRSSNCTARSFVRWRDGGRTYFMRYHPENGQARITRLAEPGSPLEHTWTSSKGSWSKSFTDFLSYKVDGVPHILRYNARNGRATFYQVLPGGTGLKRVSNTGTWRTGWTLMQQIKHEDLNFIIAYDSRTGYRQILQMSQDGTSTAVDDSAYDIKGWTHVMGFDRGENQFLVFYKASTGRFIIRRMDRVELIRDNGEPSGRIKIQLTDVFDDSRNPGWTHLQLLRQNGDLYMAGYKATNGKSAIWRIGKPSNGPQKTASFKLSRKFDIVTSLPTDGEPQLLYYGVDAGDTEIFTIDTNGAGLSSVETKNWVGGWR